ncbi:heme-binding protein [bacterium SCSIO 12696]|nr:heme-binding protein [bacterium SCSIO 12696]
MVRFVFLCFGIVLSAFAWAIEEADYRVVSQHGNVELRMYEPQILAEVVIEGDIGKASNRAFRPLFNYISGDNIARNGDSQKIAMTAPVSQQWAKAELSSSKEFSSKESSPDKQNQKIAMTAPVSVEPAEGSNLWAVSFMMPSDFTLENTPLPTNSQVSIREVPARLVAAIKYSGTWSEKRYQRNKQELFAWLQSSDFKAAGEPVWARYNSPMSLPFLRRNEVLIPITKK